MATPTYSYSPPTDDLDQRAKRMRLGTRSCAECRRRKIKCIFPENEEACQGCKLHGVSCRPQQPQTREKRKVEDGDKIKSAMQQRLEELEGVVRQICGAMDLDADSATLAQFKTGTAEAIRRIRESRGPSYQFPGSTAAGDFSVANSAATSGSGTLINTSSVPSSQSGRADTPEDSGGAVEAFEDAPLITMFKDAMLIRRYDAGQEAGMDHPTLAPDSQVSQLLRPMLHLIPSSEAIRAILEETETFWPVWPPCYTKLKSSDPLLTMQQGGVPAALTFISNALLFGDSTTIAKALLWISLCLHQLPINWAPAHASLPAPRRDMVNSYLQTAQLLLCVSAERGDTVDSIEARMLEQRIHLDMGFPKKAWHALRQALNAALILGLYRNGTTGEIDRRAGLWASAWQGERQLSCQLGMPVALPDWHPGLSRELVGPEPVHQMMYELSLIAGAISQRDQGLDRDNYAATVQMDQEWERCKKIMPPEFWDHDVPPNTPFSAIHRRHNIRLHYWAAGQLIHMPYMSKAAKDRRFEISRITCLEACRVMVKDYATLRSSTRKMVMCELLDFKAFSAAAVIAIGLLSTDGQEPTSAAADWALVQNVANDLKKTSTAVSCAVATQGTQLLDLLLLMHHGTYTGPIKYDASIPYFGRVQINCESVQNSGPSANEWNSGQEFSAAGFRSQLMSPMLEFSAADQFNFDIPFDFSYDMELQSDWTTNAYPENFDWVEVFKGQGT